MRYRNRYNTNNVNICVNVSNNGVSSSPDISQFQEKLATMSTDINLLKENVENLSSNEFFESKLNNYLTLSEIEKVKSLALKHDDIVNLLTSDSTVKYKETEVYFVEYGETSGSIIKAEIDGIWYNLNDTTNSDNDLDTLYKIPISGFIIGVEYYSSEAENSTRESFGEIKTSYNSTTGITTIFMNKDDYDFIYNRRPNNKIHVYSLIIK